MPTCFTCGRLIPETSPSAPPGARPETLLWEGARRLWFCCPACLYWGLNAKTAALFEALT